jgi:hypothetical protein
MKIPLRLKLITSKNIKRRKQLLWPEEHNPKVIAEKQVIINRYTFPFLLNMDTYVGKQAC